jgi:hypothetical protein
LYEIMGGYGKSFNTGKPGVGWSSALSELAMGLRPTHRDESLPSIDD